MFLGIYGAHGLAREIFIIAKKINKIEGKWENIHFVSDLIEDQKLENVYSFESFIKMYDQSKIEFIIGVGEPYSRQILYEKVKGRGLKFATLIHPGVYIDETTTLSEGVVICEGCTITNNVSIGTNSYIQPHAVIGHDIKIGNHSVIGTNCGIGGADIIGDRVYIGMNATTKEKIQIGNDVIISMAGAVFSDLPDGVITVGNPARIMKRNENHKVFK